MPIYHVKKPVITGKDDIKEVITEFQRFEDAPEAIIINLPNETQVLLDFLF